MTRDKQIYHAAVDYGRKDESAEPLDFIEGAKWADEHPKQLWHDADGNHLPDYDREVIVLIQDYPDDKEHLRVAFGHRPNPKGYLTSKGENLHAQTYGAGGWNGNNVRWWLDCNLPMKGGKQ